MTATPQVEPIQRVPSNERLSSLALSDRRAADEGIDLRIEHFVGDEGWEPLSFNLDCVHDFLMRYVAFPSEEAADATAAWVVHAHLVRLGAFDSSPRLAFLSPEKGSGKTRAQETIETLVPEPLHAVNMSPAAMFRLVEDIQPTLLLDECDVYLGPRVSNAHEDLRGLVNAGHRRGASAVRCVGEGPKMTVKKFPAFSAVCLAGIGNLPDTIMQRSIIISMKRRRPDEPIEPFRARVVEPIGHEIRDRIAEWSARHWKALDEMRVEMPFGIIDRPADVWEPLVTIGDAAGESWSRRIRRACGFLTHVNVGLEASLGVRLLADIRAAFGTSEKLHTERLLECLNGMDDAPWGNLTGRALDSRRLAKMLRPYDIRPADHRVDIAGEQTVRKGYARGDFEDTWQRYLPPSATSATTATTATSASTCVDTASVAHVAHVAHVAEEAVFDSDGCDALSTLHDLDVSGQDVGDGPLM